MAGFRADLATAAAGRYAAAVIGTHLTPLMDLVLENTAVHEAEHDLYLVTGSLYFLPVIGTVPIQWRLTVFGRFLLLARCRWTRSSAWS